MPGGYSIVIILEAVRRRFERKGPLSNLPRVRC
jgi:hypothetical protein